MLSQSLIFLSALAASTTSASPLPVVPRRYANSSIPQLPESSLPGIDASTIKYIGLGHGIQNYTCDSSLTASATGALAVLYDMMPAYNQLDVDDWLSLTIKAVEDTDVPLNLVENGDGGSYQADPNEPFPSAPQDLTLDDVPSPLKFLGHHYFSADKVPTFEVGDGDVLAAAALDKINAPSDADAGPLGTGAVQWLRLGDDGTDTSHGLSYVYRVETAGGNPTECISEGDEISVPYAAMYWFYQ